MAQFVPVKLDISSPEYNQWRQDHPSEGGTIPKLFVVRADGATLYGRSGSLKGRDLPEMLAKALQHSGRILNEREVVALIQAADKYSELIQEEKISSAVKAINRVSKIGTPGKIESYSESATKVNELANQAATQTRAQMAELANKMDSSAEETKLDALLAFLKLKHDYGALKILKPDFVAFQKQHTTKSNSDLARDAKSIASAQVANSPSKINKAIEKLKGLISKSQYESVRTRAQETIEELNLAKGSKD